jgi:hypothetical protein
MARYTRFLSFHFEHFFWVTRIDLLDAGRSLTHKIPVEAALTSLAGLEVLQVGRTGALTPVLVALLEPVGIAGASVRRATLHNF